MSLEILRANGLKNSMSSSKWKREYRGQMYRNTYEVVAAISLTKAGLGFEYEQHTFDLGLLGSYTPDFYLRHRDLWLETKGRYYEDNMARYDEFATDHNTILLNEMAMKSLYPQIKVASRHSIEQIESGVLPFDQFAG
jgi:hypothetical protein